MKNSAWGVLGKGELYLNTGGVRVCLKACADQVMKTVAVGNKIGDRPDVFFV